MVTDFQHRLQHALNADFQIERELGGGGMSRVFVATERALRRKVVIKVLPPELSAGVNVERFKREIQLAAQLSHPHVVPLIATGDQDGILWFSMPFIEGESLRTALSKQPRIPPRDVVRVLHDVVDALAYAHGRGIIHRDIKPDNIIMSGMHAVVLDFGVAKALSAAIPMAGGTTTGMAIGTPAYMAPEQLAADPAADHRVDIYAVGLLAYELLTGRSPFGGSSPQATMAAQLTKTPDPPTKFAELPEALSAVVMRCLEKEAAKRPASAAALLHDLEALPPMTGSGAIAARATPRRWPLLVGAVATVSLAVLVAQQVRSSGASGDPSASETNADGSTRDAAGGTSRSASAGRNRVAESLATASVDGAVKPETVVVYRNGSDSDAGIQIPVVISRAESLAIADAFRKRLATNVKTDTSGTVGRSASSNPSVGGDAAKVPGTVKGVTTDPRVTATVDGALITITRAQLAEEIGKLFADSVAIAFGNLDTAFKRAARVYQLDIPSPSGRGVSPMLAPPKDGRPRIVLASFSNTTGKREMSGISRDIVTMLRAGLPSDRFDLVPPEVVDKASRDRIDPLSLGWSLRADYIVNGLIMQRGDSVLVVTQFRDVRGGFARATEVSAPTSDPRRAFDASLANVTAWIDAAQQSRTRRPSRGGDAAFGAESGRPFPPDGRGGPYDSRSGRVIMLPASPPAATKPPNKPPA